MTSALGSRAIASRGGFGGDDLESPDSRDVTLRKRRATVAGNRYPGIDVATMSEPAAPEPAKTPIYDSLSPESRAKVDRFIIGHRLAQRGVS